MTVVELANLITKYNLEEKGFDTLYYHGKKVGVFGADKFKDGVWVIILKHTNESWNVNEIEEALIAKIKEVKETEIKNKMEKINKDFE